MPLHLTADSFKLLFQRNNQPFLLPRHRNLFPLRAIKQGLTKLLRKGIKAVIQTHPKMARKRFDMQLIPPLLFLRSFRPNRHCTFGNRL